MLAWRDADQRRNTFVELVSPSVTVRTIICRKTVAMRSSVVGSMVTASVPKGRSSRQVMTRRLMLRCLDTPHARRAGSGHRAGRGVLAR
jgi:hypothetical protein